MDTINKGDTIGALLFGGLVACILFGITSTQVVTYYQQGYQDGRLIKTAVSAHPLVSSNSVFILDGQFERDLAPLRFLVTIDIGLIFNFLYSYLITNYGNFDSVAAQGPTRALNAHFTVIALTQSTADHRKNTNIQPKLASSAACDPSIQYALTAVDVGSNIALGVIGSHEQSTGIGAFERSFKLIVCINFGSSFAGDSFVALCLCYLLQRSRVELMSTSRTESIVKRIIVYVISTGLLTTMVQSSALVLFLISSRNFVYLAVLTQVSKLYVNAYLALLNDRNQIREIGRNTTMSISVSRLRAAPSVIVFNDPANSSQVSGRDSRLVEHQTSLSEKDSSVNKAGLGLTSPDQGMGV
ncbi:hypothetical protein BC629DRAFT_1591567 [Irpex lacteus]|nr:hypothetical protein BC629DRAFT_1591567 [Irpex lacteus]